MGLGLVSSNKVSEPWSIGAVPGGSKLGPEYPGLECESLAWHVVGGVDLSWEGELTDVKPEPQTWVKMAF